MTVSARRLWYIIGFTCLFILLAGVAFATSAQKHLQLQQKTFTYERADTPEERAVGLSDRDSLPENAAMLFVFEDLGEHCFWMKDTRFPLDMIWLNGQKQVVHIEADVQPESYPKSFCPDESANYVVEVNAGQVAAVGLQEGDSVTF